MPSFALIFAPRTRAAAAAAATAHHHHRCCVAVRFCSGGWEAVWAEEHQMYYYCNRATGVAQWVSPGAMTSVFGATRLWVFFSLGAL